MKDNELNIDNLNETLYAIVKNVEEARSGNKSASKRARVLLGKIKKNTPKLRAELMELDNK